MISFFADEPEDRASTDKKTQFTGQRQNMTPFKMTGGKDQPSSKNFATNFAIPSFWRPIFDGKDFKIQQLSKNYAVLSRRELQR